MLLKTTQRLLFRDLSYFGKQILGCRPIQVSHISQSSLLRIATDKQNVEDPPKIKVDYLLTDQDNGEHINATISPEMTSVILFPGQGSQFVGMGKHLLEIPRVEEMFRVAKTILGYDLMDKCLHGPSKELNSTEICQPAVFVTSLAAVEKLREINPNAINHCVATAGFSVGEITALVFAGVLKFEDALRLVNVRAKAMQAASEMVPSGMMTVFLRPDARIKFACQAAAKWCEKQGVEMPVCGVGNYLFAGCKVISGHMEALKFIETHAKDFGIKKYKYLPVSGGFHTELMKPAAQVVEKALNSVNFSQPRVQLYLNTTGHRYRGPAEKLKDAIVRQIYRPVLWEQSLHQLYSRSPQIEEFPSTYECGPGTQLKSMLKVINGKAGKQCTSISV